MRRSAFFLRFIGIGILFHLYVGVRLIPDAPVGVPLKALAAVLLAASVILIPLGMAARQIEPPSLADRLAWFGLTALGFFSSLLLLTFARDVMLFFVHLLDWLRGVPVGSPRLVAYSALAVPMLAVLFSAIGFYNARRRAPVVSVDVPIDDLPAALDGFTIVQISDIHVGPTIKRHYVERIVAAVNGLEPDLIAVTGDVVDGTVPNLADHTRPLAGLSARHGAFLVTGNHEYYSGADKWIAEFRRLGLNVLLNQHVVLNHDGAQAVVAGVTDYSAGSFDPAHRSDPAKAISGAPASAAVRVLLAHQPRSAAAAAEAGFTLQLSGHTHGGQFLPWNFFVRLQQPFVAGLEKVGGLWVYTSRGTGYWGPPKRLGAPSEITRVRLVPSTPA
ncbi:ser/threonine protein phosphatase [Burkholderia sp. SFA1]|uniref:metallophosphoesterase n=1 Tax=unclassified Caballeronia TaxID=2646786 RepID=UPI001F3C6BA3|nr:MULTISPECIES: metallophosphoesterase [unclassified Caballeronia]MCE4544807.1 metallophosphoesterase [Caballeronia sp. PC1]MCE4570231.1 metallophosphoesterase [Caballeronia sp. CLC5]BBP98069.1 ser/threonine protein phosphatase [Burkholderia sp. SFA1]